MAEQVVSPPVDTAQVTEVKRVSAEEYMERYAHDFYEWVKGELIEMTPVSEKHDTIARYLSNLLEAYLSLKPVGQLREAPFVMRVDATESRREPDLQIILNNNPGDLTDTAMVGPADICVEVVSPESAARDRGEKFIEYEKGGVKEYWLLDPVRQEAHFYRLDEKGIYKPSPPDEEGNYHCPTLPGLRLHVPTLWEEKLPDIIAIVQTVQAMLGE